MTLVDQKALWRLRPDEPAWIDISGCESVGSACRKGAAFAVGTPATNSMDRTQETR